MTNTDASSPVPVQSPLDRLTNRAPIRHAGQSPIDWYIRLADWHLTRETDAEHARR